LETTPQNVQFEDKSPIQSYLELLTKDHQNTTPISSNSEDVEGDGGKRFSN